MQASSRGAAASCSCSARSSRCASHNNITSFLTGICMPVMSNVAPTLPFPPCRPSMPIASNRSVRHEEQGAVAGYCYFIQCSCCPSAAYSSAHRHHALRASCVSMAPALLSVLQSRLPAETSADYHVERVSRLALSEVGGMRGQLRVACQENCAALSAVLCPATDTFLSRVCSHRRCPWTGAV